MINYTFKNKKETDKEFAHIDVMQDGNYIGYITSPKVNKVCGLWHFSGKPANLQAKSKKELLDKINVI